MSLVHESLISALNRRFISTYYNTFNGPGHDEAAIAFATQLEEQSGKSLQYGAIVTPDGEFVASFGYDREQFFESIRSALTKYPALARLAPEEEALFKSAEAHPNRVDLQLSAARLEGSLLEFAKGRARLDRLLRQDLSQADSARVRYLCAHLGVLDLSNRDLIALDSELNSIEGLAEDLQDDRAVDRWSLGMIQDETASFFGGWILREKVDEVALATEIEQWLTRAPKSNRRGEMLFYLGVARHAAGDLPGASQAWARCINEQPNDPYALPARLQHPDYKYSPNSGKQAGGENKSAPMGGQMSKPEVAAQIRKLLASGMDLQVQGNDGRMLSGDEAREYLESILAMIDAESSSEEPDSE